MRKKHLNEYMSYFLMFISLAGAFASLYSCIKGNLDIAIWILSIICLLLSSSFLIFSKKYYKYKKFYSVRRELGNFSNRTRKFFEDHTDSESDSDFNVALADITNTVLNTFARTMTYLVGNKCTASLMLTDDDEKFFETVSYSDNVDQDRENNPSKSIGVNKGLVGKCTETCTAQIWCYKTGLENFENKRDNFRDFYQSGMVCPVFINGGVGAILNVDAKAYGYFNVEHKDIAMIFSNTLASVYEVCEFESICHEEKRVE